MEGPLSLDVAAVRAAIAAASDQDVVKTFVKFAIRADLSSEEIEVKMWWRLVGSAVEHAARLAAEQVDPAAYADVNLPAPRVVDFQRLFLAQDDEDEDSNSLAEALAAMRRKWSASFDAGEIARFINERGSGPSDQMYSTTLREFFYPNAKPDHVASAQSVGGLLVKYVDDPVRWGDDTRGWTSPARTRRQVADFHCGTGSGRTKL